MTEQRSELNIERISASLGAVVTGVDLSDLNDATFKKIEDAFYEHLVVIFPNQEKLEPESHAALVRRFGELLVHSHQSEGIGQDMPWIQPIDGD